MFSTKLCTDMFRACTKLERVTFTEDFTEKANKVSYTDHKNTIKGCIIDKKAFYGCTSLKNFVIPEGVGGIDNGSFGETPIENLYIPASVGGFDLDVVKETLKTVIAIGPDTILRWNENALSSDTKIYACTGTQAEEYANDDGLTFIDVTTVDTQAMINSWLGIGSDVEETTTNTDSIKTTSVKTDPVETTTTKPDSNSNNSTTGTKPVATTTKPVSSTTATEPIVTNPQPTTPVATKPVVKKTTVKLAKSSATLYRKGKTTIKTTVKNGKGKTTYKSSNSKIAKVNAKGVVTALKKGTAKITVTNNGVKKTFKVTVKNPKLNATKKTLKVKKSFTLKITGKVGKATFTSSNSKTAKVNSKGKITAKKKGTAYITVKTNGIKLKCKITVK
jgi:hypothetical protein